MRFALPLLLFLALGCQVSPVITEPSDPGTSRYSDCKRAARDYCRDVVDPGEDAMRRCVSKSTFECISAPGA